MSKGKPAFVPKKSERRFVEALMKNILDGAMVPKLQVERALAPVIGFFIESILTEILGTDVVMLSPEFPLKKYDKNNHSENIDWMMLDTGNKELLLVEFKSNDTSFNESQMESYKKFQKMVFERGSSSFLIDDIEKNSR